MSVGKFLFTFAHSEETALVFFPSPRECLYRAQLKKEKKYLFIRGNKVKCGIKLCVDSVFKNQ